MATTVGMGAKRAESELERLKDENKKLRMENCKLKKELKAKTNPEKDDA